MTISGKYELVSAENFDAYLTAVGVSPERKKVLYSEKSKSTIEVTENGKKYKFHATTPLRNVVTEFEDGKPFTEESSNGRKSQSTITRNGNVFNHTQVFDNMTLIRVYTFADGTLTTVYQAGVVKATTIHKRV